MAVNPEEIDNIVTAVEKAYESGKIHKGSEAQRRPRIPFPSLELNIATGGGIPIGCMSRIFGNYSSGKTLNMLYLIRNAQNLNVIAEQYLESEYDPVKKRGEYLLEKFPNGLECAYYNIEGAWDKQFASDLGIDVDRLFVVEGSRIEEVATVCEASLGGIHLHIFDSLSNAASVDEIASDITDWHRGIKARVWNKALDHINDKMNKTENSVVLIDQVRIDQSTGAYYAPGGEKLEHNSRLTIHFRRGKWLYRRGDELKEQGEKTPQTMSKMPEADGFEIQARVTKSHVGRPLRTARLQIELDKEIPGVDFHYELAKAAEYFKVVEVGGSWFTLPDGEKVQGKGKLREAIINDPELQRRIQDKVELHICENP